jgi:hypothetical protein
MQLLVIDRSFIVAINTAFQRLLTNRFPFFALLAVARFALQYASAKDHR